MEPIPEGGQGEGGEYRDQHHLPCFMLAGEGWWVAPGGPNYLTITGIINYHMRTDCHNKLG